MIVIASKGHLKDSRYDISRVESWNEKNENALFDADTTADA